MGSRALTKEELIEKNGIKPSCGCCNKPFITLNWCAPYPKILTESNLCFSCHHWIKTVIPHKDDEGRLSIKSQIYSYNPKQPLVKIDGSGAGYGFGGREFTIYLKDGKIIKTNNLWSGGITPNRFIDLLPDNASFGEWPDKIGHGQGFLG